MFRSKTVFVVGAGASKEAGFPDGAGLKAVIANLLNISFEYNQQIAGDPRIALALREVVKDPNGHPGDINPLRRKCQQIRTRLPMALSIDNYIEAHSDDPDIELCGKLGIVKSILDAEASSRLKHENEHDEPFKMSALLDTWYAKFFGMLVENVSKPNVGKIFENISIITFNYDRSIERYLVQALEEYYELPRPEAEKLMRSLKIYHPYGQVGDLPWQNGSVPVRYGNNERSDLLAISKEIKTFSEGLSDKEMMSAIRGLVMDAKHLVFLGFAFHPQNVDLLKTHPNSSGMSRIFATVKGISPSDQGSVKISLAHLLNRKVNAHERSNVFVNDLTFEFLEGDCAKIFGEYWRSLSAAT
jgi:hypothetical protein